MPKRELRFSISSGKGTRASTWKCWSPSGKTKTDLYIANREIGHALKVSLHESGKCHLAYFQNYWLANTPRPHHHSNSRFVDKWEAPAPLVPGLTLVLRIVTPSLSANTRYEETDYKKMNWLRNSPDGKATEIDIFLTDPGLNVDGWPGKNTMKNQLVGSFELADGSIVWVLSMVIDMPDLGKKRIIPYFFNGKEKRDLVDNNLRMLLHGDEPDGSKTLYDCVIMFKTKKIAFLEYLMSLNISHKKGVRNQLPRGKFFNRFR
jgi:hypothetical protein